MKNEKKSCCGCFGTLFKTDKPRPKMIEAFAQTDIPMPFSSKIMPEVNLQSCSARSFFPRASTPVLPGIPRYRTSIITGNKDSRVE